MHDEQLSLLARRLSARQEKVFVLEASAGGAVQALLSARPGASAWLLGGLNCYHDKIKTDVLGLDPEVLAQHGAVSELTVSVMAQCALRLSGADWVIVESGVYGPGGGSPEKPVGLVVTAIGRGNAVDCQQFNFNGSRRSLREQIAGQLLQQLIAAVQADDLAVGNTNLR